MSRHELVPRPSSRPIEVSIGWDPPLSTYFAIVRFSDDGDDGCDPILLWAGTAFCEIDDPEAVIDLVQPFADVPDNLGRTLRSDRELDR